MDLGGAPSKSPDTPLEATQHPHTLSASTYQGTEG